MNKVFLDGLLVSGLTYEEYRHQWQASLEPLSACVEREERKRFFYRKYNFDRSDAVHDAYRVSDLLREQVRAIQDPQYWMILTETWCADSAFCIPVIAETARLTDQVHLRLLIRDENLDVMDQFLTNGGRAIPKLVAFDEAGAVLFTWGSRPAGAVQLREELKASNTEAAEISRAVVKWYEQGGWREVDAELAEVLSCVMEPCL